MWKHKKHTQDTGNILRGEWIQCNKVSTSPDNINYNCSYMSIFRYRHLFYFYISIIFMGFLFVHIVFLEKNYIAVM